MKNISLKIITFLLLSVNVNAQSDTLRHTKFLNIQTGFIGDNYNSAGIRFKTQYSKQIVNNWYCGTLFEMKLHQFEHTQYDIDVFADIKPDIAANTFILAEHFGYRLQLRNDRISWYFSLAAGMMYLNGQDLSLFMPVFLADITLNIRITKKLYVETAPLIIFPPFSSFFYSFINYGEYNSYYGINMFPVGFRYKF